LPPSLSPQVERPAPARSQLARSGPLVSLRHRDFRFLLGSSMALQIGSWVQTIGMGWLVLHDLHGNATDLGLVALLRGASMLLLSPVGGHLAGKLERRRQLMIYTGVTASIATLLAVLITSGHISLWVIFITAAVGGVAEALAGPLRTLLVYDAVGGQELTNAVALNALAGNAMRVIGPALGGVLIGTVGTQGAFQAQAVCLVLCIILTSRLRPSRPEEVQSGEGIMRSLAGGLGYVGRDRRMLVVLLMAVIPSMLIYPYVTYLPVFATDVLHSNETGYGYLAAAVGLGALLGGTIVAYTVEGSRMGSKMVWSCLCYCLMVGAFTFSRNLLLSVGLLSVAGVFFSVYSALNSSMIQLLAQREYRSRVVSLLTMTAGITPFSSLLMGRMIDGWGAPPVVAVWVGLGALSALLVGVFSREMRKV
jgi:MFS family permease